MNLADLRARTRQLSGAELEGLRDDHEVDDLVREAYRQIGRLESWRWREATVPFATEEGQAEYELPSTVDEILAINVLDVFSSEQPRPLEPVALRDVLGHVRRDDDRRPRFYARKGARSVRLAPTPDEVYHLEVYGLAPLSSLAEDFDEPEFDSSFHAGIAYLAASVLLHEEGQDELSQMRRVRAEEFIGDMRRHYQLSRDIAPMVLGGGPSERHFDPLGRLWPWRR